MRVQGINCQYQEDCALKCLKYMYAELVFRKQ
jgi:hypothetical protein